MSTHFSAPPRSAAATPQVPGVKAVVLSIKAAVEGSVGMTWVEGEVTGLSVSPAGHAYFDLNEEGFKLPAVLFRGRMRGRLPEGMQNGKRVRAYGRVTVYERGGRYQIIVDQVQAAGIGEILVALERLREQLSAEGLFAPERKKEIPFLPKVVGVVTSPTGAAVRDIIRTAHGRYPAPILLYPARVQGVEAPDEIVRGIRVLDRLEDVEIILVGRGGGSLEDLLCFSDERVVRAVAEARTPVISGVGHETDTALCDLAADWRAATPTAAAERALPDWYELQAGVRELQARSLRASRRQVLSEQRRLEGLRRRLRDPRELLQTNAQRLDDRATRLRGRVLSMLGEHRLRLAALRRTLSGLHPARRLTADRRRVAVLEARLRRVMDLSLPDRRTRLRHTQSRLAALSPEAHLRRGYALLRDGERLVRSADEVETGDNLRAVLWRGSLDLRVEKKLEGPFGDEP